MAGNVLIEMLPDLVVLLRRDGVVLAHGGGHDVSALRPPQHAIGERLDRLWPEPVATLLRQLMRKVLAQRAAMGDAFQYDGRDYEVRVSAQGPDRAVCVIRAAQRDARTDTSDTGERPQPHLDRRGFLKRFRESMSRAALRESPMAVAVIHIDGIGDIAQVLAVTTAEHVMSAAIRRLPALADDSGGKPGWYLGQIGESLLALVLESSDRDAIEGCVSQVCANLREPVETGGAEFHLTPYAGVAILGQDASSPRMLLDNARAAASDARRSSGTGVRFFSDTVRLRGLARLDLTRELRAAIAEGHFRLRYVGRHDLASGALLTQVGYLRWHHALRGEVRPAEFLRVAETTGLALALSRALLARLREDWIELANGANPGVRISFGPLRHHVLHEEFADDIRRFLDQAGMPAESLELRIAEKSFIAQQPAQLVAIERLGVRLVVDEVGRGLASLDWLARAPIWGLQLDRAWVTQLRTDEVARKVCGAGIGVARALGLTPIATGVDDGAQRDALLALGCRHGSGDLYRGAAMHVDSAESSGDAAASA
ncbi:MAG TPA: bifunctional diguanylate cyclase/phosphodiesterase [Steroidobacteraceae bacterium]|nr:bifunctional diguanylate cyclase/phosphodiesterase [Steroidobacteraceae bacterium]